MQNHRYITSHIAYGRNTSNKICSVSSVKPLGQNSKKTCYFSSLCEKDPGRTEFHMSSLGRQFQIKTTMSSEPMSQPREPLIFSKKNWPSRFSRQSEPMISRHKWKNDVGNNCVIPHLQEVQHIRHFALHRFHMWNLHCANAKNANPQLDTSVLNVESTKFKQQIWF